MSHDSRTWWAGLIRHLLVVGAALALLASCKSPPEEVGVFLKTTTGWVKLPSYDWEPMTGGYQGTADLLRQNLPVAPPGTQIVVHKVPLDPSALFYGRNAGPRNGPRWQVELESQPVSVVPVGQDSYEISTSGLAHGAYGLIAKAGALASRAYFFRVPMTPAFEEFDAKNGFWGMTFGTPIAELSGLTPVDGCAPESCFVKSNETLEMGAAKLHSVYYHFFRDRLLSIQMNPAKGHGEALLGEMKRRFGNGETSSDPRITWMGDRVYALYVPTGEWPSLFFANKDQQAELAASTSGK